MYNDAQYYYITNQMGDVIGIINSDGEYIANYIYDDWGKIVNVDKPNGNTTLENTIADTNPMLYRGYYYDYESGYYYLQSRYYSPELTRFLSADDIDAMFDVKDSAYGGANGYSYCCNDPVNGEDPNGLYNRNKAINYALNWWYIPNVPKYYYFNSSDCANFVSQCLHAGGLPMDNKWYSHRYFDWFRHNYYYDISEAWSYKVKLFDYLTKTKKFKAYKCSSYSQLKEYAKKYNFQKGDVGIMGNATGLKHATIISKISTKNGKVIDVKYAGHTNSRYNKTYKDYFNSNKRNYLYVIKIS